MSKKQEKNKSIKFFIEIPSEHKLLFSSLYINIKTSIKKNKKISNDIIKAFFNILEFQDENIINEVNSKIEAFKTELLGVKTLNFEIEQECIENNYEGKLNLERLIDEIFLMIENNEDVLFLDLSVVPHRKQFVQIVLKCIDNYFITLEKHPISKYQKYVIIGYFLVLFGILDTREFYKRKTRNKVKARKKNKIDYHDYLFQVINNSI